MNTKIKKGFSLVELLVAMAIIAVLISIAAYGIQIVQRNARNTKRRKVVQDLQLTIADYQTNSATYTYPENSKMALNGCTVQIDSSDTEQVIKGFTTCSQIEKCPAASTDIGEEDDKNTISLCYDVDSLQVGVKLEGTPKGFITSI